MGKVSNTSGFNQGNLSQIHFLYKNALYKNTEAHILDFEMGFLENVHASFKLITKYNRGYPKKCFRHIIEGESRLKMCRK